MRSRLWIQRMIVLLSILMIVGFGTTTMVQAAETPKDEIKLTEEFLTGTWVCSEGFVCSYESGTFSDSSGKRISECKVNNDGVTGTTSREQVVSTKITMIDNDTIQVGEYTAVRAESKLGKEYQALLANLLFGKWLNHNGDREVCFEFKKDNSLLLSSDVEKTFGYELAGGGIKVYNSKKPNEDAEILFYRIHEDTLIFCNVMGEVKFYREGSDASIVAQSGKAEVVGEWIFVSNDGKLISQWKFDASDILTIDYLNKDKDIQQTFSTSRKNEYIVVTMGGKIYNLRKTSSFDDMNTYEVSGDLEGILVRKDSDEGKYFIKKAKVIYKAGNVIQRTQYKKFNDDFFPEVTAISVSLECMSNIWLTDVINIEKNFVRDAPFPGGCGLSYIVDSKIKLKNAKITFTYDESELPYAYEKDLVIVHIDSKTMKRTILKTTKNLKSNKVAAQITEGGLYYLADSVVVNGGTRDITKRNPKTTEWARKEDTGDILSLIDLEYIKNSEGYFVVSTVSELASVVYYVNTTPDAITYVTLEKDIDLSGYAWAPMGWSSFQEASFGTKATLELMNELAKGKKSGEEKGWLSSDDVREHCNQDKHEE